MWPAMASLTCSIAFEENLPPLFNELIVGLLGKDKQHEYLPGFDPAAGPVDILVRLLSFLFSTLYLDPDGS